MCVCVCLFRLNSKVIILEKVPYTAEKNVYSLFFFGGGLGIDRYVLGLVNVLYYLTLIFVVVVFYDIYLKRRVEHWGQGSSTLLYQDQSTFYTM